MIVDIDIEKIKDFDNHPFKVVMDESMKELLQSVTINGIINPLIVRKKDDYYEIISGHRRKYVAGQIGIKKLPCIIKEFSDEEAIITMVDSNIQRENVLPSEKAFAYKMKLDAMKHQGRKIILTSNPLDWELESAEIIGKENDKSAATIRRYIRLTYLIPDLLEQVDLKRIAFRPAVELSYLSEENQYVVQNIFEFDDITPSLSQAIRMKKLEQEGKLKEEKIEGIMKEQKPNQKEKFSIAYDDLRQYFPKSFSNEQINNTIIKLLKQYYIKNK